MHAHTGLKQPYNFDEISQGKATLGNYLQDKCCLEHKYRCIYFEEMNDNFLVLVLQ